MLHNALRCIAAASTFVETLVGIDSDPILAFFCVAFLRQIDKIAKNIEYWCLLFEVSCLYSNASLFLLPFLLPHTHSYRGLSRALIVDQLK